MEACFFGLVIFVFGLIIGSFLNCLIYRIEAGESFLRGRSYCPQCKHVLGSDDLIPVLSFLLLRGRCRYCKAKISWQYPLVELATGLLFVSVYLLLGFKEYSSFGFWIFDFLYYLVVLSILLVIFVYDLKHYIIPDRVIYPAIFLVFVYNIIKVWSLSNFSFKLDAFDSLMPSLFSAYFAALPFFLIVVGSKERWMGMGDVKLVFLMGLFFSFPNILIALNLSFFIGSLIGLLLIFLGKKKMSSEIPFGPFLVLGTYLALFFGLWIIDWYLGLFLVK